jgi:O-antigen/teichoic acid export membrane protein
MKTDMQQHGSTRRVIKNSLFLLLSRAQGTILTVIIFSLTARYLGSELFGLLAVIVAISMTIRPIADFGFENIICREISKNNKHAVEYVGTTVNVRIVSSLAIAVLAYFISNMFLPWSREANHALMIAIATELCMSMGVTYLAVIRAYERMGWEFVANTVHKVASLILLLVVIFNDMGFISLFYARLLPAVIHILLSATILYVKFVKISFKFNRAFSKFILKESYPIAIFTLLLTLIFKVDIFILQWLKGAGDVAIFEVPNRLISQVQILAVSISLSLFPALSRSAEMASQSPLKQYYRNTYKILLFAGVPCAGLMFTGGAPLISLLVGKDFMDAAVTLRILAPATVFLFLISLQNILLTAIGRQIINAITIIIALVVNIVLDLMMIPHYGYVGASVATLVSYFILLALNEYFVEKSGVKLEIFATGLRITLAGVMMCLPAFVYVGNDLTTLVLRFLSGLVLYSLGVFMFKAVTRDEIKTIRDVLFSRRKRESALETNMP